MKNTEKRVILMINQTLIKSKQIMSHLGKDKEKISVVIPVYNEEKNVTVLRDEVFKVMESLGKEFEIIFIDDGSADGTFSELKKLARIKIIKFRKNFGQTAAMDAGIKNATGDLIIPMDGDMQNDPADIPKMIQKLKDENLDVVAGWRKNRKDPVFKKFFSFCAAKLRRILIDDGIHDSGCTLKIYKRECFDHVDLVGEMHRFIPGILSIKGFRVGEIEVNHRSRALGRTKYGLSRGIKGVLDMFSVWFWKKYASRPLHLFGTIGLFLVFVSSAAGIWAAYLKIFEGLDLSNTALTNLFMFGFLIGIQFLVFGLLADMLSKNYFASTKDKVYDIESIVENE
ncbi:MAG: glycosyltransferase family 2 protein [Candidatus Pacebacteria bacterium]|nr:glycosyltransferase family 2 protein [Candidatus Paceibacterota bacterium]